MKREIETQFKHKPNLKKRIIATLLDYLLFFLVFYMYVSLFGEEVDESKWQVTGWMTLPLFMYWFLYFVVVEGVYGATFGHQSVGLKVLQLNRNKIGISHAFKRHLLDCIDIVFYGIPALIAIKNSEKHQRLGDMWAQTIVVDTSDFEQFTKNT